VAIIGAGPYGLSLAAHLAADRVEHRIFGHPMQFWSNVAAAGGSRFLRTYCFGTTISTPRPGFTFPDYSGPRGLETFEPCSISDFADYGQWFQRANVPWVERTDVVHVSGEPHRYKLTLADGPGLTAEHVVVATGLAGFAYMPAALGPLRPALAAHTSEISSFAAFEGRKVAVIGAGQSALEAAALLSEAGAQPCLLVRERSIDWMSRVPEKRNLWRRLRSPISALGSGPVAWTLAHFPGAMHHVPDESRARIFKNYLTPGGAWWLRHRIENQIPIHVATTVEGARETSGRVVLNLRVENEGGSIARELTVDHVIAGTGYNIDVDRLSFLDSELRSSIQRLGRAPRVNASFETSVPGLHVIGPASAMSFGPLFRFVAGCEYASRVVSAKLASRRKPMA
jgi:FAD-dependent urate hydroxylase